MYGNILICKQKKKNDYLGTRDKETIEPLTWQKT